MVCFIDTSFIHFWRDPPHTQILCPLLSRIENDHHDNEKSPLKRDAM